MREIVEALLQDVDPDIKALMLKETDDGEVWSAATSKTMRPKNWETLPDPLFFIIQWQELRNENRLKEGFEESRG